MPRDAAAAAATTAAAAAGRSPAIPIIWSRLGFPAAQNGCRTTAAALSWLPTAVNGDVQGHIPARPGCALQSKPHPNGGFLPDFISTTSRNPRGPPFSGRHGPATAPDPDSDASPRASRRTHRRSERERELRRRRRRRKSQAGPFAATRRRRRRAAGPGLRPSESACEAPSRARRV